MEDSDVVDRLSAAWRALPAREREKIRPSDMDRDEEWHAPEWVTERLIPFIFLVILSFVVAFGAFSK